MLMIQMVLVKNHKQKGDFSEVEGEDDGEELESGCETDEENGCNRNKYLVFKLSKNMVDYKWELRTFFATKSSFKKTITTYAIQSGIDLKFSKNDKRWLRLFENKGVSRMPIMTTYQIKIINN